MTEMGVRFLKLNGILLLPAFAFLAAAWRARRWSDAGFLAGAAAVLAGCFLLARHVLLTAYREKIVVGTSTEWDYVDHQGFLTTGTQYSYCEPIYRYESLYHAVLWLLPLAVLLVLRAIHNATRSKRGWPPSLYLGCGLMLALPYLLYSYVSLNESRLESIFYIDTSKPRIACPPNVPAFKGKG